MKMPFGQHRGRAMADVPSAYLEWLSDQEWPHTWTKRCVLEELALRKEMERLHRLGPQAGGLAVQRGDVPLLRSMIDYGARAMRLRSHPGTAKRLDSLIARLRVQLDQVEGVR